MHLALMAQRDIEPVQHFHALLVEFCEVNVVN
jgi:hypothetical protein